MTKFSGREKLCIVLALCTFTAMSASAQKLSTLIDFDDTDGADPLAPIAQGSDGAFYGTTYIGGANSDTGTVLKITANGTLTTLYSFCGKVNCTDGVNPSAGLVLASDGNFYGTANEGGANFHGTVFRITQTGMLTTLYSFCAEPGCVDGDLPVTRLVQATNGRLYGGTYVGGTHNRGTIFGITRTGVVKTLYSFGDGDDGYEPLAGLTQATDGLLYGTTAGGGANNAGTIFKMTLDGKLTTLHNFCSRPNCTDGYGTRAVLVEASDGSLYGTTYGGGTYNYGTVFRFSPKGTLTTLHSFDNADGSYPDAGLVQATDGNLYGTTVDGGDLACNAPHGCGTLFQITPAGTLVTLHTFESTDGWSPIGELIQATNGQLYGTTQAGGDDTTCDGGGCGTIFSFDMGLSPFVTFVRAAGRIGQTGPILGQGFIGTTSVSLNGTPASFTVVSDTFIRATVPPGATTGYVTVVTPSGTLISNVPFRVIP